MIPGGAGQSAVITLSVTGRLAQGVQQCHKISRWRRLERHRLARLGVLESQFCGVQGLAAAYYLARDHGITDVAVLEKRYIGSGGSGRPHHVTALARRQRVEALLPPGENLVVHDWDALQPGLKQAIQADISSAFFMYFILVILVAFSVLNTVLMSVFVRQRLTFFISSESRTYIDPLVGLLAAGDVVPAIGRRAALAETADAIRAIEAGSGSGKTVMGLYLIARRRQPAIVIVHTKDLAHQWVERIQQFLGIPEKEVGFIGGGRNKVGSRITGALVQSL